MTISKLIYEKQNNLGDIFIYANETNPQNEIRYVIYAKSKIDDSDLKIQKWFRYEHNAINMLLKYVKDILGEF